MKTNDKRTVLEIKNGIVTIHSMTPKSRALSQFRCTEMNKAPAEDKVYEALAQNWGNREESHLLDSWRRRDNSSDTYTSKELGYSNVSMKNSEYIINSESGCPVHILRPLKGNIGTGGRAELQRELASYCNGEKNDIPFSVDVSGNETQRFLPLDNYERIHRHLNGVSYSTMYALRLTDEAYLEQLLRSNKVELFLQRAASLGINPRAIFDLYSFKPVKMVSLKYLKDTEKTVKEVSQLLYGDVSFIEEDPYDRKRAKLLSRPVSEDLEEQLQIDEPLVLALKNNHII